MTTEGTTLDKIRAKARAASGGAPACAEPATAPLVIPFEIDGLSLIHI